MDQLQLQLQRAQNVSTVPAVPYAQDMCYSNDSSLFSMCSKKEFVDDDLFQLPVEKKRDFTCLIESIYRDGRRLFIPYKCITSILKEYADIDIDAERKNLIANHMSRKDTQRFSSPESFEGEVKKVTEKIEQWFEQTAREAKLSLYKNKDVRGFLQDAYCNANYLEFELDFERSNIKMYNLWLGIGKSISKTLKDKEWYWSEDNKPCNLDVVLRYDGEWGKADYIKNNALEIVEDKDVFDMYKCIMKGSNNNLFHTFAKYRFDLISRLIDMYPQENLERDINAYNLNGKTPLMAFMISNVPSPESIEEMKAMTRAGADIRIKPRDDRKYHENDNVVHVLRDREVNRKMLGWIPYIIEAYKKNAKSEVFVNREIRELLQPNEFYRHKILPTFLLSCYGDEGDQRYAEAALIAILDAGEDITVTVDEDVNVFHLAAKNNPKLLLTLAKKYPKEKLVDALNQECVSYYGLKALPLLQLADSEVCLSDDDFLFICEHLIVAGASIAGIDKEGRDLFAILREKRPTVIPQLIENLSSKQIVKIQEDETLDSLALFSDHISREEFILTFNKLILKEDIDITQTNEQDENVLHILAAENPIFIPSVMSAFTKDEVKKALHQKDREGFTPLLRMAKQYNYYVSSDKRFKIIFEAMVDAGADVTEANQSKTAFHFVNDKKANVWDFIHIISRKYNIRRVYSCACERYSGSWDSQLKKYLINFPDEFNDQDYEFLMKIAAPDDESLHKRGEKPSNWCSIL